MKRVNLRSVNKRSLESLAYGGAFDCFPKTHRAQFFHKEEGEDVNTLEKAIKFGNLYQKSNNSNQLNLFGEAFTETIREPELPVCEEWPLINRLKQEREMIGIYLSGHPLDAYKMEMETFCNTSLNKINKTPNRELRFGCMVTNAQRRFTKTGNEFGIYTVEDYDSSYEIRLFGEEFVKHSPLV